MIPASYDEYVGIGSHSVPGTNLSFADVLNLSVTLGQTSNRGSGDAFGSHYDDPLRESSVQSITFHRLDGRYRHALGPGELEVAATWGRDVFIPLDNVIGGVAQVGKGWKMLMSALAAGRGISLPSLSAAGAAFAAARFASELAPVTLPGKEARVMSSDEHARPDTTAASLAKLPVISTDIIFSEASI